MKSKTEEIAGGIVQVIAAIAAVTVFIIDKGLGMLEGTLPHTFYLSLIFISLGAKLSDIKEILLKILLKK